MNVHPLIDIKEILIIDDDPNCYLYLKKGLELGGYNVTIAKTGKEGYETFKNKDFDAVLVDIFLPDIDGVEIARRLRKERDITFPIIGVTFTNIDSLKQKFPELHYFTEIFIKPFEYHSIIKSLKGNPSTGFSEEEISFQSLISSYQASIPERLELLNGLILEMKKKPNEKTLKELRLQIHKLAGNAGLYGYGEVSKICKEFDQELAKDLELFFQNGNVQEWIRDFESYLEKIKVGFKESNILINHALEQKILNKNAIIGVIGLGNIGLSLLDAFGRAGFPLLGFDIDKQKIQMLQRKENYLNYFDASNLFSLMKKNRFKVSSDPYILKEADIIIISVQTSIDRYGTPNLTNLRNAFRTVLSCLKKQQLIVLQSSTYPGTTREEFLPILLKANLNVGIDFYLAHVPEIADIGNSDFNFTQMPHLVSGITPSCLKRVSLLYENISSKVIPCSSTEVAESAKLLQNAFRLINISFVNEMKILFDSMNIDIWEVISAAATKPFGFMPFYPSPGIGGDCIPIAPMYLAWKAKSTGGPTTTLDNAKRINDEIAHYVINKLIFGLNSKQKTLKGSKILVIGVAYKKDINDIRESAALKIISILKTMLSQVDYHDPYVKLLDGFPDNDELSMQSIELDYENLRNYDAVIIITDHSYYDWPKLVEKSNLVIDTRDVSDKIIDKRKIVKA